ncbi:alpha/beta hydrolase [Nocardia seriolae]|nr:alpha/beta hydrolase [Nocardia seriolae]WNJ58266.1 alpha/beta hydrolase [Nocardia seriolae]
MTSTVRRGISDRPSTPSPPEHRERRRFDRITPGRAGEPAIDRARGDQRWDSPRGLSMLVNRKRSTRSIARRLGTATAAASLLAVAGLVGDLGGTLPASAAPPEAGMDRFLKQQVKWGACDDYPGGSELPGKGLQCARVTVPIDYKKPDGKTAEIAISRLAASGRKIGSLLTNPGGPGGPGLAKPVLLSKTKLAERFDIIGVDVRGLGASTPSVQCQSSAESQFDWKGSSHDRSDAGIAQTEKDEQTYVASCRARTDKDLLEYAGTVDVARDFDLIRTVLGDEKLNYLGYSYGTRLGSTIAELFPTKVRAMVLDGGVDPAQGLFSSQSAAFQRAFEDYATSCAKSADCPLGTDPKLATQKFRELALPLLDHPVPTSKSRTLGYSAAIDAVETTLYSQNAWPTLTKGLTELTRGNGDTLLALHEIDSGSDSNVFNAVRCLEEKRVTDRTEAATRDRENRSAAPFRDDGRGTGKAPLDVCAFWPIKPTAQPHTPKVSGLPKIVVVATTDDPATPYKSGVALAKAFDAGLITYEAEQHTVFGDGVACVDDPVVKYLTELTVPADGLRCAAPA